MNKEQKKLASEIETSLIVAEEKTNELIALLEEDGEDDEYDNSEEAYHEISTTLGRVQELFEDALK